MTLILLPTCSNLRAQRRPDTSEKEKKTHEWICMGACLTKKESTKTKNQKQRGRERHCPR
jgi:hypothetical protein